jgi:hypothetical protein
MAQEASSVQRSVSAHDAAIRQVDGGAVQQVAAPGGADAGGPLPHGNTIGYWFGSTVTRNIYELAVE